MDVWTLGEKFKIVLEKIEGVEKRVGYIEDYLKGLRVQLEELNKVNREKVQDKKPVSSSVRTKRSSKKS
jgi:hypothetical protein